MSFWLCFYLNQARRGLKRDKKFSFPILFPPDPSSSIPKKIVKNLKIFFKKKVITASFLDNPDQDKPKKRKKNFISSIVSTQLGLVHSKKNGKKIKKCHSIFNSSQTGLGHVGKELKKEEDRFGYRFS